MTEKRGLHRKIMFDGVEVPINPASCDVEYEPGETFVKGADYGGVLFSRLVEEGHVDTVDAAVVTMNWDALADDQLRVLRRIRSRGGLHELALWKEENYFFTASDGQTTFYLPRYRRNAPQVLGESTSTYPFRVWVNGVEFDSADVLFANGPTVTAAAGKVTIARDPQTSGANIHNCMVKFGTALALGDVVEFEFFPLFSVYLVSPRVSFPQSKSERFAMVAREG